MSRLRLLALVTVAAICVGPPMHAQTFAGFVTAGANANQVNGDDLAGYNQLGAFAGVGVYSDLSDRWRASLIIAYSQYGSRASAREGLRMSSAFESIGLDYVSVPVRVHYMDWLSADETFYHLEFMGGLEYQRLISGEVISVVGEDLTAAQPPSDNGVAATVGLLYAWSLKWGAGLNYQRGISDAQSLANQQRQSVQQLSFRLRRTF